MAGDMPLHTVALIRAARGRFVTHFVSAYSIASSSPGVFAASMSISEYSVSFKAGKASPRLSRLTAQRLTKVRED